MFMNKDKRGRKIILIFTALVILGFSIIFSVRFGSVNYTSGEILKSLFIKSYDEPKTTGLRINTLKINKEELLNLFMRPLKAE